MRKRYIVVLSKEKRARLQAMIGRGVAPASALTHVRIPLKPNQGAASRSWSDAAVRAALEVNPPPWPGSVCGKVAAGLEAACTASRQRDLTAAGWTGGKGCGWSR